MKMGWSVKRETGGSHRVLEREGWPDFVFSFHDGTEIGPRMLSRIAKQTGLSSSDLSFKKWTGRLTPLQDAPTPSRRLTAEQPICE